MSGREEYSTIKAMAATPPSSPATHTPPSLAAAAAAAEPQSIGCTEPGSSSRFSQIRTITETAIPVMACKISSLRAPPRLLPSLRTKPTCTARIAITCTGGGDPGAAVSAAAAPPCPAGLCRVEFRTMPGCELGISRYPGFAYDASGGAGTGEGESGGARESVSVSLDVGTLYILPLTGATTRFLGLPLLPFLRIDIVPELFRGLINRGTGQVDLDFQARFYFSVGSIYGAPPLTVETKLTSESSKGSMRSGRGRRVDGEGLCRLVGVAKVEPVGDLFMDTFLGLPTECIAMLNARIFFYEDSAISGQEQAAAPRAD